MFDDTQRRPFESFGVFVLVLLFHVLGIWGILFLLHSHKKEEVPAPLEVKVVGVASAASAAASHSVQQPPAPEMIVPPPPDIEPPPINTEAPIQPKPPTVVKKQKQKKMLAAKPAVASSNDQNQVKSSLTGVKGQGESTTPGEGPPDRNAGSHPLNGIQKVYPPDMEAAGKEATVIVSCDVEASGYTSNCRVINSGVANSFKQETLRMVRSARYSPAIRHGVPVKELNHRYAIVFKIGD